MLNKFAKLRRLRAREIPHYAVYWFSERFYERRFGIESGRFVKLSDLGFTSLLCGDHAPVKYRAFFEIMRSIDISEDDVFLDYGSGMGRAVIAAAATFPLKRAIGVDISPYLTELATRNLERARSRLKCTNVEFLTTDATTYVPSADCSIIFFNNPFKGHVLSAVVENLHQSFLRQPRRLRIVFMNPQNYKTADADFAQYAAESSWLEKTGEFRFFPPGEGCVYETIVAAPPAGRPTVAPSPSAPLDI